MLQRRSEATRCWCRGRGTDPILHHLVRNLLLNLHFLGQDSTFFRGILDKMQSKGLQNCPRNIELSSSSEVNFQDTPVCKPGYLGKQYLGTRATLYVPRTVLEALGLHLIQDPSEKGGDLTLYPGFAGSETGASWEYCFSRYPGLSPT